MNQLHKNMTFVLLILLTFKRALFAQSGTKLMIDENDGFSLQSVPIYEGVDEFESRLEKIRNEEKREPLGLVLCGGSARAFAHIGALKALEENNVTPDFIIANSMGAIIGMLYAYGFSPDQIAEVVSNVSLTEYFEPVIPIHGGVLSVRKFRGLVNDLLGKEHSDLRECQIPILVLTEDLYTKRQIWHARGDMASVMTAAFAMSAIMEPTRMNLNDEENTPVSLIDSGAIDIAGLTVAESFSSNIVISTAFYDAVLDYNNAVVVLNRTMSIGKERVASRDIKQFKPVVIRNNVEHFSFMAFDKAMELADIGYASAMDVIDEVLKCPHGKRDFTERRKFTSELVENTIRNFRTNEVLKTDENYFGIKVWPVFPSVDFPNYFLYDKTGVSAYLFEDVHPVFVKFGVTFPFNYNQFCIDGLFRYKPSSVFEASIFASYGFDYNMCRPLEFYGAATVKLRPLFFPYAMKGLFLTAEYSGDYALKPEELLITSGLHIEAGDDSKGYISFKPYYFISGNEMNSLSNGIGGSLQGSLNLSAFSKNSPRVSVGIADSASVRYAFSNFNSQNEAFTRLYECDFFRAEKPEEVNDLVFTNASEIFFVHLDPGVTAAELIILQQFKVGAFYDIAYNGSLNECAGGFCRAQISLIGLCNFIFEGGCGWNITDKDFFGYFVMKNRI